MTSETIVSNYQKQYPRKNLEEIMKKNAEAFDLIMSSGTFSKESRKNSVAQENKPVIE